MIDYVYFMQAGQGGPIKIGRAEDPEKRLRSLRVGNPESLQLLMLIPGGRLERFFHRRFRHLRIRGEWFQGGVELTGYVNSLAGNILTTMEVFGRMVPVVGLPEVPIPASVYTSRLYPRKRGRPCGRDYELIGIGMGPVEYHAAHAWLQLTGNERWMS